MTLYSTSTSCGATAVLRRARPPR